MQEQCIDKEIGQKIKRLDYSFDKINPDRKELYRQHLEECKYCKDQALKEKVKRRSKGVLNILGGVGLLIIAPFIPIPFVPFILMIAGIGWIAIGLWRLISGRD